jgi:hypothetical protein
MKEAPNLDQQSPPQRTVVILSCVKSKREYPCLAQDMYISPLFQKMLHYAQAADPDHIFILSAKYGLLQPTDTIEPYEKTLNGMSKRERSVWSQNVLFKLRSLCDLEGDKFIFLAGKPYREGLLPYISHYELPMEGLTFGRQLQWLTKAHS